MRPMFTRAAIAASLVAGAVALSMSSHADPSETKPGAKPAQAQGGAEPKMPQLVDPKALERLKTEEGTWDAAFTLWVRPGAEPIKTNATLTARMVLGGMFLEQRFDGVGMGPRMPDLKWTSMSFTGYNPTTKDFEATRMATTHSTMIVVRGPMKPDGTIEMFGEYMFMGMKSTQRDIITSVSNDEHRVESWMKFGDSPEFKGAEMVLTRRK